MTINQLESLKVFEAVVELGSFKKAADKLNMSPAKVSICVKKLEDYLGVSLIKRSTRKLQVTSEGYFCAIASKDLAEQWEELECGIKELNKVPKGELKVGAPVSWGIHTLSNVVSSFSERYPEIKLNITLDDKYSCLLEENYDFVLRLAGKLDDSSNICTKLKSYKRVLCASPDYLNKFGIPEDLNALREHRCLMFDQNGSGKNWRFYFDGKVQDINIKPFHQLNNSALLRQLLLSGSGIALIPSFLITEDLDKGRVKPILTKYDAEPLDLYLLRPYSVSLSERHKLFVNHIVSSLRD